MSFPPNHFVDVRRRPFYRQLINSYICWRAFGLDRRASLKSAWAISRWRWAPAPTGRPRIAWWVRPTVAFGTMLLRLSNKVIEVAVDYGIKVEPK